MVEDSRLVAVGISGSLIGVVWERGRWIFLSQSEAIRYQVLAFLGFSWHARLNYPPTKITRFLRVMFSMQVVKLFAMYLNSIL